MKFEVRSSGGTLYGWMEIYNLPLLRQREIYFARLANPRFYGYGLREPGYAAIDPSHIAVRFAVSEWMSRPCIGVSGSYYPGRVDFVLIWDGPVDVLRDIPAYQELP